MIEVRYDESACLWLPMVICDICEFPIAPHLSPPIEKRQGIAAWSGAETQRQGRLGEQRPQTIIYGQVKHVHKGRCDTRLQKILGTLLWEELPLHLEQLCYNAGLGQERDLVITQIEWCYKLLVNSSVDSVNAAGDVRSKLAFLLDWLRNKQAGGTQ